MELGISATRVRIALAAAAVAALAAIGIAAVSGFAAAERARELRAWQTRLGIVADSRAAAVDAWLERQYDALAEIADNLSVQIYMTELAAQPTGARTSEALAQSGYLENLLKAVADRTGFTGPVLGPEVAANVRRVGVAGIALLDRSGRIVAQTPGAPPLDGALAAFVAGAPATGRALLDVHVDAAGKPAMGFALPVLAVQGNGGAANLVGRVVGVREIDPALYRELRQPGQPWKTAEAILVRTAGAAVEVISPMQDGAAPLSRRFASDTPDLAEAYAIAHPGGFGLFRDTRDAEVLATVRPIAAAPWSLLYKIDRAEALADSESWLEQLIAVFLLAIALVAASLVAAWRHGASLRASRMSVTLAALAAENESQKQLLRLVTDSQRNAIALVDRDGRYRFANRAAAERAGIDAADMVGKTIAAVLGPAAAERSERLNESALASDVATIEVFREGDNGALRIVQSTHVPVPGANGTGEAVLMVENDITAAVTERERSERILKGLVRALVRIVDARDPYAADHSARVARVALGIAEEMGLDAVTCDTAETAGRLMNLGKILVPAELLTKPEGLTDEEMHRVQEGLRAGADLLAGIEFVGPVVETLRQLQERWDGSGTPAGAKGEQILLTARIVAVANAFIAMTSDRAFRRGLDADEAAQRLMAEAGRAFDRRVVAALVNRLDNRGGRAEWSAAATDSRPSA